MVFLVISFSFAAAVQPFGASTVNVESSVTATPDSATSVAAQAGNVTELNIFGVSVTQTWQGYFGNVSGTIQLSDAADNVMYNWSVADPEGEIYASRLGSVSWESIECFNWVNNGTWLENNFSIAYDDVDGVNETFSYANEHDEFFTNNIQFTQGECMSTKIYDSTGVGVNDHFEEVLLWDGEDVVFTSLLEEASVDGFDGKDHDFEMLVLEDGHDTDTDATTYFFYVELQ
ncbi:MAG: hypothetical protein PF542_02315 [Nanoarchaeota archaeon]|nr:hypothetical protein [Nanoarchaeota archaeon]